jgi:hypothetical protein
MIVSRPCDFCQADYQAESRYLSRGQGRFCSRSCSAKGRNRVKPEPNVECALCRTWFHLTESKKKGSKSGLFFCSREHKDQAQRIGGIEAIMPPHYGTGNGSYDYRKRAFDNLPNECKVCGWNDYPEVLEVNHKDVNRSNNNLSNLEILCPTHHQVFHFLDGSGRWAHKRDLLP